MIKKYPSNRTGEIEVPKAFIRSTGLPTTRTSGMEALKVEGEPGGNTDGEPWIICRMIDKILLYPNRPEIPLAKIPIRLWRIAKRFRSFDNDWTWLAGSIPPFLGLPMS
jgi:hypothetical protein